MTKSEVQSSKTANNKMVHVNSSFSLDMSPYVLTGDVLMLIPLMPDHCRDLHAAMFGDPGVMRYVGTGKCFTIDEYIPIHSEHLKQNQASEYNKNTGHLSFFTWTIITHEGMAGRFRIFKTEGKTEFAFSLFPSQQGRGLARRASELAVKYLGEETSLVATAHPENIASSKTLESIHYPDGKFVFFRDPTRQNVANAKGPNQPRDFFLSRKPDPLLFFSFYKDRRVHVDDQSMTMDYCSEITGNP